MRIAFFGTPSLTLPVLDELHAHGFTPSLIIAAPDKPVGRKQVMTAPESVLWADKHGVPTWQPTDRNSFFDTSSPLQTAPWDVFVIFAYGSLIPSSVLEIPRNGAINLHPSLLPKLRGPSPIRSAILTDQNETGVSVMLLDEKMDHGPILAQQPVTIPKNDWPISGIELDTKLIDIGAKLLSKTLKLWHEGKIEPREQEHEHATYCRMIKKEDAKLPIDPYNLPTGQEAYEMLLRIRAYEGWPVAFFEYRGQRVKITKSTLTKEGKLLLERVIPAGKKEMDFYQYMASFN